MLGCDCIKEISNQSLADISPRGSSGSADASPRSLLDSANELFDPEKDYSTSSSGPMILANCEERFNAKREEITNQLDPMFKNLGASLLEYLEIAFDKPELCCEHLVNFLYKFESEISAYVNKKLAE